MRPLMMLLALTLQPTLMASDIRMPKIFSDHMVFQRDMPLAIWGWTEPGQRLVVTLADRTAETQADADGSWQVRLEALPAGGPHELRVAGESATLVFGDVWVGEVWLCAGQANMQWPLELTADAKPAIESASLPRLRLFTVQPHASQTPLRDFAHVQSWAPSTPEAARRFSATAFYFGRELLGELDVPIGLIHSSWSGTPCEAWSDPAALRDIDSLQSLMDVAHQGDDLPAQHRPGALFNGMIAPVTPFSIRGVIWYQGESNVGRGAPYRKLFPATVRSWRSAFGRNRMPFYFVQLAPYRYTEQTPQDLPEVWDAQLSSYRQLEHTGIVVTTDVADVTDIHPQEKRPVGRRLARWALARTYNVSGVEYSGPLYAGHEVQGGEVWIRFDYGQGLTTRDGRPPSHFTIAGEDQRFVPAAARIEGDRVVVRSDDVPRPVAVRFGWTDTAQPNLVNRAGLPASPFRTDDFELSSAVR